MSSRAFDSDEVMEEKGGDEFAIPAPLTSRYGSRVVATADGAEPSPHPGAAEAASLLPPMRRAISGTAGVSAKSLTPPQRIISTVKAAPPPRRKVSSIAKGPFGPPTSRLESTPKSSFVPSVPRSGLSTLRQGLAPVRSTRAFASRIKISLVSIPEGAASKTSPVPKGVGSRIISQRPAPQAPTRSTASTIQGTTRTVRLSVQPAFGSSSGGYSGGQVSFAPKRLLDIENGKSILVTQQHFLDDGRYQELDANGALVVTARAAAPQAQTDELFFEERSTSLQDRIQRGTVREFEVNSEVGVLGGAWRGALKRLMLHYFDEINGMRLSRLLQLFLPFQTGYEAYILGQLIEAMDAGRKSDIKYVLNVAFKNRNVSRILVQVVSARFDFFWHWHTQITWNRLFDAFSQVPIVGITGFTATENFPATRNHALASMFRVALGQGNWLTRVITGGREGLVTDNPNAAAQNLAAESNGFELANRNQHGTYIGRRKTNNFRWDHRLPVDESLVRTFVNNPAPTMINNGVVHMLRQVAKHWNNMLYQFSGNFAHQRMEQLNPFETLRFHMPVVLLTLANLRGRNKWDGRVLGHFIRQLQSLKPSWSGEAAKYLVSELKNTIIVPVSAGIASVVDPFMSWVDAIGRSVDLINEEAKLVYEIVTSVEVGIRLGHDLITQVSWKIPGDKDLKNAILNHIRQLSTGNVNQRCIGRALTLVTPRDKRTLVELVKNGLATSSPAQLLLGRAKTLLQRELRREVLNGTIRSLSKGEEVTTFDHDEWYWVEDGERKAVYIYDGKKTGHDQHRFVHVDTNFEKFVSISDGSTKFRTYVPVAEAITRAQRAFMNIELDHGKKFIYDAFMEFTHLRLALRRLVVISQIHCDELDNARLNVLAEIQRSNQTQVSVHDLEVGRTYYTYNSEQKTFDPFVCQKVPTPSDRNWDELKRTKIVSVPPQSTIVVGGGPTGLMTIVHCTEAVLTSSGVMKLYEARDAFAKGGATFERAQIVRLDARWIGMLRYHLGTGFEDVYIPASGETDSQLGNTLPTEGFVEITIKDLENMLHVEISKMWAKGLIQVYTDARSQYDVTTNSLTKMGQNLSVEDSILRRFDENGNPCTEYQSWKVVDLKYTQSLSLSQLQIGNEYAIYNRLDNAAVPHKLTGVDLESDTYTFKPLQEDKEPIKASSASLPTIYPKGVVRHAEAQKLVVECVKKGRKGGYVRNELPMAVIRKEKFTLDVGHTHVVECIGKPHGSDVHFSVTTYEPYGVCCIQGLKVSMGMHNFGEKRWGNGIIDDIRSQTDQNTRIIGDFTKMVRSAPVAQFMFNAITDKKDKNWQTHFNKLVEDSAFPDLNEFDPIVPKIQSACEDLAARSPEFRRQTLQTRFFETGDNYYLGMEFTREYDSWKNALASELVAPLSLKAKYEKVKKDVGRFRGILMHHIDRLWYDGVLEVIRTGDVYNPGARSRVPRLYLINSYTDMKLGSLPVGESFRLSSKPEEKYEVMISQGSNMVVRNVEGYISKMSKSTLVKREGNLTRSPDGNNESKVSLATFPVGHYVNFRTMRLNSAEKGYAFAFVGDEQATPHFMRYSGLTGACINAFFFNTFIKQAVAGIPFIDRFQQYSVETNWSNGEVVQRGTTANYGDGFLRPGFSYADGLDYLHSKIIEYRESDQDLDTILSRDWMIKITSSMVPRGMELNESFMSTLYSKLQSAVFEKFIKEVIKDDSITITGLGSILREHYAAMAEERASTDYDSFWNDFTGGLKIDNGVKIKLGDPHICIARRLDQVCSQIMEYAGKAYLYNERVASELLNQPKPVDSIVDDFAVEAQNFANSLTQSAALSAGALAFSLVGTMTGAIFSGIVAALNIIFAFGTITNVSRYKIRNEEARIIFNDEKMQSVLKGVFSVMNPAMRAKYPVETNPFVEHLDQQADVFFKSLAYYDIENPKEFKDAYEQLKSKINDPLSVREFQTLLTTKFLADTYHVNSYIQECLVNIYKTCEDMHFLLTQDVNRSANDAAAKNLFDRLIRFRPKLEKSLQRGPTRFGFLKKRKLLDWDVMVVFKFFLSYVYFSSKAGSLPLAPISTETLGIVKQTRHLSGLHQSVILRREIRDLETLYWGSRESDIASLIFMSGFLVFIASILFTIARIFSIEILLDVAFWASLPSAFGAILASFHLVRKFFILVKLWGILAGKTRTAASTDDRERIRQVRRVTFTQIILTVARLISALAAAVALPWSVAENGFGDEISTNEDLPFWIALGAVGMAILSTLFFFFVEYRVRYNLDPKLGEYVCESFREEIENMYKVFENPPNDIDTKQVQERENWEYTAREFLHKYRFDTVFAADRFGSILQYVQSGMDARM